MLVDHPGQFLVGLGLLQQVGQLSKGFRRIPGQTYIRFQISKTFLWQSTESRSPAGNGRFAAAALFLPSGIGSDIEACAQVDHFELDELYTLDEDNGRIARVVDIDTTPTVDRVWNLEVSNNGHALPPETSGAGDCDCYRGFY